MTIDNSEYSNIPMSKKDRKVWYNIKCIINSYF